MVLGEDLEIGDCEENGGYENFVFQVELLFMTRLHDRPFKYSIVITGGVLGLDELLIWNASTIYFLYYQLLYDQRFLQLLVIYFLCCDLRIFSGCLDLI